MQVHGRAGVIAGTACAIGERDPDQGKNGGVGGRGNINRATALEQCGNRMHNKEVCKTMTYQVLS